MKKGRKYFFGFAAIFFIWAVWCLLILDKGVDATDEGQIASDAWRLFMGDGLFVDTMPVSGLSPWFLSIVFHFLPDCGLLGLRIVWAIILLINTCLSAAIMLKYFKPCIAFAGAAAGMLMFKGTAVMLPSYNSIVMTFILLSVLLWFHSYSCGNGLKSHLLAAFSGIVLAVGINTRITILPALMMPVITVCCNFFSGEDIRGECRRAAVFVLSFLAVISCFLFSFSKLGLLTPFLNGILATNSRPEYNSDTMLINLLFTTFYFLFGTLVVIIPVFVFRIAGVFSWMKIHWKSAIAASGSFFIVCILLSLFDPHLTGVIKLSFRNAGEYEPVRQFGGLGLMYYTLISIMFFSLIKWKSLKNRINNRFLILITIAVALPAVFFIGQYTKFLWILVVVNERLWFNPSFRWLTSGFFLGTLMVIALTVFQNEKNLVEGGRKQKKGLLAVLSLFFSFLMIVGTDNVPAFNQILSISFLSVSLSVCFIFSGIEDIFSRSSGGFIKSAMKTALMLPIIALVLGYTFLSCRYPYRSDHIRFQTEKLEIGRLKGIYTTPARASALNNIHARVEKYSKKGERILALENAPLLYFAFDRLPAPAMTWTDETQPELSRQNDIESIRLKHRTPRLIISFKYSLRHQLWPDVKWPIEWKSLKREKDPIRKYIDENFHVIDESEGVLYLLPN